MANIIPKLYQVFKSIIL